MCSPAQQQAQERHVISRPRPSGTWERPLPGQDVLYPWPHSPQLYFSPLPQGQCEFRSSLPSLLPSHQLWGPLQNLPNSGSSVLAVTTPSNRPGAERGPSETLCGGGHLEALVPPAWDPEIRTNIPSSLAWGGGGMSQSQATA